MDEKKLYRVEISGTMYVLANNDSGALSEAEWNLGDMSSSLVEFPDEVDLDELTDEKVERLKRIIKSDGWTLDSLPYGGDEDKTLEQIIQSRLQSKSEPQKDQD